MYGFPISILDPDKNGDNKYGLPVLLPCASIDSFSWPMDPEKLRNC